MVGIPGRSKGCVTCRKRKKGCDQVQPECGQCKERGIKCGGYDSDRIFIYQNGGSNRPVPKEAQYATTKTSPNQPSRQNWQMAYKPAFALQRRDPLLTPVNIELPNGLAKSAYTEKTIAAFLEMYSPAGTAHAQNVYAKELATLLPLLNLRDEALQAATLAVGITQLGITTENKALTRQGRVLYGKALKETALALRNPSRANSEPLLAVPRVMALFDMLFGAEPNSYNQAKSWLSHAEGELAMILSRGPEAFASDETTHALFTNARSRLLWPAIRDRKPTILNTEEWMTLPWKGRTKTSEDLLMDIFCGIPELLEATDRLQYDPMDDLERETLRAYALSKCWTLHSLLADWTQANTMCTPEITDPSTKVTFPDIDNACITVRYWLVALFLYSSFDIASGVDISTDYSLTRPDRPHPRPFARMIVCSTDYLLQEQFGITGLLTIWFPLGNTLFYMNRNRDADEEYILEVMKLWCRPKLPSVMREFLKSFRLTVDMYTLSATPLREL
ncbi:uncharacterized protein yc1106_07614 [Curvularia clavata]|uniref:Zn(2)-C6 fungal-type domain-containing protein n=1 Tax=Curvularia clavata TaxID=95742 RepID=A0A9Q8ZDQ9_CURCL|nr:uncharacterized protein yc1106_07614 [Curvularia clavata]